MKGENAQMMNTKKLLIWWFPEWADSCRDVIYPKIIHIFARSKPTFPRRCGDRRNSMEQDAKIYGSKWISNNIAGLCREVIQKKPYLIPTNYQDGISWEMLKKCTMRRTTIRLHWWRLTTKKSRSQLCWSLFPYRRKLYLSRRKCKRQIFSPQELISQYFHRHDYYFMSLICGKASYSTYIYFLYLSWVNLLLADDNPLRSTFAITFDAKLI